MLASAPISGSDGQTRGLEVQDMLDELVFRLGSLGINSLLAQGCFAPYLCLLIPEAANSWGGQRKAALPLLHPSPHA